MISEKGIVGNDANIESDLQYLEVKVWIGIKKSCIERERNRQKAKHREKERENIYV